MQPVYDNRGLIFTSAELERALREAAGRAFVRKWGVQALARARYNESMHVFEFIN